MAIQPISQIEIKCNDSGGGGGGGDDGGVSSDTCGSPIISDLSQTNQIRGCLTSGMDFQSAQDTDDEQVIVKSDANLLYGYSGLLICCPKVAASDGSCCYGTIGPAMAPGSDPWPCATPETFMGYSGAISGNPRTGIFHAFGNSTKSNFTGVAAIINEETNQFEIRYWVHESLATEGHLIIAIPKPLGWTGFLDFYSEILAPSWWFTTGFFPGLASIWLYEALSLSGPFNLLYDANIPPIVGVEEFGEDGMLCGVLGYGKSSSPLVSGSARWHGMAGFCGLCYQSSTNQFNTNCTMNW